MSTSSKVSLAAKITSFEEDFRATLPEWDFNAATKSRLLTGPRSEPLDSIRSFPILENLLDEIEESNVYIFSDTASPIKPLVLTAQNKHLHFGFEDGEAVENQLSNIDAKHPSVFVLAGQLERSNDPRLILRKIRGLLKLNSKNTLVVTTPNFSSSGKKYLPANSTHTREWSVEGLKFFFTSSGFTVESIETTAYLGSEQGGILAILKASEDEHRKLLSRFGFPNPKHTVILATEHADTAATGGIGSYIKEVEENDPTNKPIVLFGNYERFEDVCTLPEVPNHIIDIQRLIQDLGMDHSTEWKSLSTSMYRALKNFIYLYDQVGSIEYQEYLGVGARIAAAKQVGEFPFDATLVARCHGSQLYIDRAAQKWSGIENGDVFELERMSIRYADIVSFPTKYLRDLYQSNGYEFDFKNAPILRLPYHYLKSSSVPRKAISRLAFVGKRNQMKGYGDFCATIIEVTDPTNRRYVPSISEVLVLGAAAPGCELLDEKLERTLRSRGIALMMRQLPRFELLRLLDIQAADTLYLLPYGGDNHPVAILEMIASHSIFISYSAGGVPELIPKSFRDHYTVPPDQSWLAEKVVSVCKTNPHTLQKRSDELHIEAVDEQLVINQAVAKTYRSGYILPNRMSDLHITVKLGEKATIMVPCFNTPIKYVESLIASLNALSTKPKEVIFINDASTDPGYLKSLQGVAKTNLSISYRIINHKKNTGLSGARNTGLRECTTKYLINIDSDDLVSHSTVYDYVKFLDANPAYDAAVCGLESFFDKEESTLYYNDRDRYRYLALGDCYALGITKNIFGHAGSCVVVDKARQIGGWDASDRSMWEDWAFYLKMTSMGGRIFAFPKVNYFYRVNNNSMVRSYPEYPASLRLVRNLNIVNIWESHRIFSYLKDGTRLALSPPPQVTLVEPSTRSYKALKRIENKIHNVFHKYPAIHTASKKALRRLGI